MVELFSCSSSVYAGIQYADHDGKMKRKPIEQPCLPIYDTTVLERFFASITQSDAVDGFLARFLVMESKDYTLKPEKLAADINDPPEELLAELRRWKEAPSNYDPKGNIWPRYPFTGRVRGWVLESLLLVMLLPSRRIRARLKAWIGTSGGRSVTCRPRSMRERSTRSARWRSRPACGLKWDSCALSGFLSGKMVRWLSSALGQTALILPGNETNESAAFFQRSTGWTRGFFSGSVGC